MDEEEILSNDLQDIMKDFRHLREFLFEEQKSKKHFQHVVQTLKEEIQFVRSSEKTEHSISNECRILIGQQQETINKFLNVKDENSRLLEHSRKLEETVASLKSELLSERTNHELKLKDVTRSHKQELDKLRENLQQEVHSVKKDLELAHLECDLISSESTQKLEALQDEKIEEMNVTVTLYEEKIDKLEKALAEIQADNKHIQERAAANIAIYKKKVMELEQAYICNPLPSVTVTSADQTSKYGYHNVMKQSIEPEPLAACVTNAENELPWQPLRCSDADVPEDNMQNCQTINPWSHTNIPQGSSMNSSVDQDNNKMKTRRVTFPAVKKRKLFNPNIHNNTL